MLLELFFDQVKKDHHIMTEYGFITEFFANDSNKNLLSNCHENIQKAKLNKPFVSPISYTTIDTMDTLHSLIQNDKRSKLLKIMFKHHYIGDDLHFFDVFDKKPHE